MIYRVVESYIGPSDFGMRNAYFGMRNEIVERFPNNE